MLDNEVKLHVIGNIALAPDDIQKIIKEGEDKTKHCTGITLNLALSYGGRDEIVQAVQAILSKGIAPEQVDERCIADHLFTAGQPDPDLLIRTGGNHRLSNFLLWQSSYSELYFTDVYWPDFNEKELDIALDDYAQRVRRFGK
jgi:undecaprenyl diphosphate synthase